MVVVVLIWIWSVIQVATVIYFKIQKKNIDSVFVANIIVIAIIISSNSSSSMYLQNHRPGTKSCSKYHTKELLKGTNYRFVFSCQKELCILFVLTNIIAIILDNSGISSEVDEDARIFRIRDWWMVAQDFDVWKGFLDKAKTQRWVVEPMMVIIVVVVVVVLVVVIVIDLEKNIKIVHIITIIIVIVVISAVI